MSLIKFIRLHYLLIPHNYTPPTPHLYFDRDLDKTGGPSWLKAVDRRGRGVIYQFRNAFGRRKMGLGGLRYQELYLGFLSA